MQRTQETLSAVRLLEGLASAELDALARRCTWRRFAPHQQILGQLDETTDVYFVVQGKVRAISYSLSGKEVTFRDIEIGGTFGEFAAIDGEPRSSNVVALQDSLIASLSADAFWEVLRNHPEVSAVLLRRMTRHARELTERVFEFSALAVKNRIHAELLRLALDHMTGGNTAEIGPAPTHADIASRVSTQREAVTRELNELARAGVVEQRGRRLRIKDVERLSRMVHDVLGF